MQTNTSRSLLRRAGARARAVLRRLFLGLLIAVVALAGMEGAFRAFHDPDRGFSRFLLFRRLNLVRWSFLSAKRQFLQTAPSLHGRPNVDTVRLPQKDRPAFDLVAEPFHLVTNSDGYRERPFVWPARRPLVFALGDSNTFGKGVEAEDRFTDRLESGLPAGSTVLNFGVCGLPSRGMADILEKYLPRKPDLVILQASTNDADLVLWRRSQGRGLTGSRLLLARAAANSHLLMWARYKLLGDPFPREMPQAWQEASACYRPDLERMAKLLRERRIPLVVVSIPMASGYPVAPHVARFFKQRPDLCLGVLNVSFKRPQDWLQDWELTAAALRGRPDWVSRTAQEMGLAEERIAPVFPYRHFFLDNVHPSALGHAVIAAQLGRFLQTRWRPAAGGKGRSLLAASASPAAVPARLPPASFPEPDRGLLDRFVARALRLVPMTRERWGVVSLRPSAAGAGEGADERLSTSVPIP